MICHRSLPPERGAAGGDHLAASGTLPAHGNDLPGDVASPGSGAAAASAAQSSLARGASAGRPARRLLDLGLLNFLLVLIGTSSLVAGTWNARRHVEIAELRGARDRLERERGDLVRAIEDERRWYEGIENDPLLEKELLGRLLGPSPEEGIPLSEWLRGSGPAPQP